MPTNAREARESEYIMRDTRIPWFVLQSFILTGAEDPPEGETNGDGDGDGGDGGDGSEDGDGDNGGDDGGKPEDTAGLKSALEKERRENARKDRELKRLQKAEEDRANADKTEVQRATEEAEKAKNRAERLANGFRDEKINNAIIAAANKQGFHDVEDAVLAVDRESISYDQDDDDPSVVKVDRKTVEAAVKRLATSKPHLVKSGTTDGQPTGSQFGGGSRGKDKETDEETFRRRYSAL